VLTYWHNKQKLLTRWALWVKFAPLGLALLAVFRPLWALAGLLSWVLAQQAYLAWKMSDYPWPDRLAAWLVQAVHWSGYNLELVLMAARYPFRKLAFAR
jgi:hypothetical protein